MRVQNVELQSERKGATMSVDYTIRKEWVPPVWYFYHFCFGKYAIEGRTGNFFVKGEDYAVLTEFLFSPNG